VRVSGTIRKAQEEAVRRARLSIRKAQKTTNGLSLLIGTDRNEAFSRYAGIEDPDESECEETEKGKKL
jgi:ribonuclease P/MRP protein subunit POP5